MDKREKKFFDEYSNNLGIHVSFEGIKGQLPIIEKQTNHRKALICGLGATMITAAASMFVIVSFSLASGGFSPSELTGDIAGLSASSSVAVAQESSIVNLESLVQSEDATSETGTANQESEAAGTTTTPESLSDAISFEGSEDFE